MKNNHAQTLKNDVKPRIVESCDRSSDFLPDGGIAFPDSVLALVKIVLVLYPAGLIHHLFADQSVLPGVLLFPTFFFSIFHFI